MTESEAITVLKMVEAHGSLTSKAKEMAIQALEEIQAYRAMEERLKKVYGESNGLLESVVSGLERHENLELPSVIVKSRLLTDEDVDMWDEYRAIGTVEDFKALKEKNEPYKPIVYEDKYYGCKCGEVLLEKWEEYPKKLMPKSWGLPYCLGCGQKLDWQ